MTGLLVLIGPGLTTRDASFNGTLLLLAAAVLWGAGTVLIKSQNWTTPIIILTGWQFIFGGIPILLGMLLFETGAEIGPISTKAWLAVAYSALVPMIICHLVWYTLIGMLPASIAKFARLPYQSLACTAMPYCWGRELERKNGLRCTRLFVRLRSSWCHLRFGADRNSKSTSAKRGYIYSDKRLIRGEPHGFCL